MQKTRQAQNRLDKLKGPCHQVRPTEKIQQTTTNDSPTQDFEFEELDLTSTSSLTGSKFFQHSPVLTSSNASSIQQSKKRPSESPQNPKDRRMRSRSASSKPEETGVSKSFSTQPTK